MDTSVSIPRCDTAERPPSGPTVSLTDHVLYCVAETDADEEFYVWADSVEAVVSVVFSRAEWKRLPAIFRGIKVMR